MGRLSLAAWRRKSPDALQNLYEYSYNRRIDTILEFRNRSSREFAGTCSGCLVRARERLSGTLFLGFEENDHDACNARRLAAMRYKSELSKIDRIKIPFADYASLANYHIFPVLLDESINRQSLMIFLREKGIQTSIHYPPIHQFSFYKNFDIKYDLPLTEYVGQHELTLPMFDGITDEQICFISEKMRDFFHK